MLSVSLPITLHDGAGFVWDIQANGAIARGTDEAFDVTEGGGLQLIGFPNIATTAETESDGREVVIGPFPYAVGFDPTTGPIAIEVTRKIYVPPDRSYARFLDVFENTQDFTIDAAAIPYLTELGLGPSLVPNQFVATSSGDNLFQNNDHWVVTDDDREGDGVPAVAQVLAGPGGAQPIAVATNALVAETNELFSLTLEPGDTAAFLHFAVQSHSRATAIAVAQQLESLELNATEGMNDNERTQVRNFVIPVAPPLAFDFGDAPAREEGELFPPVSYPTLLGDNGARHQIVPSGPFLGTRSADRDADGQPSPSARGDDTDLLGGAGNKDDEDAIVSISTLARGQSATIEFFVGMPVTMEQAFVDAWIDFNRNGIWEPSEYITQGANLFGPGLQTHTFQVPSSLATGPSYLRMRINSKQSLGPGGPAEDGEVEDHLVILGEADYGDAPTAEQSGFPNSYPTRQVDNGASHAFSAQGPFLEDPADVELDGQPSVSANGDDAVEDDEDGLFLSRMVPGRSAELVASLLIVDEGDAYFSAWLDFNRDGDWDDEGEWIVNNEWLSGSGNSSDSEPMFVEARRKLTLDIPKSVDVGPTYLRMRASSERVDAPTDAAIDGEVEDHRVEIVSFAAMDDEEQTDADEPIEIIVLANDLVADDANISIASVDTTVGTLGSVRVEGDHIVYDPNGKFSQLRPGERATDKFIYTVSDGVSTDSALVTVTVNGQNDPPQACPSGNDTCGVQMRPTVDSVDDGGTPIVELTLSASDPDGDAIGLAILALDSSLGEWEFNPNVSDDPSDWRAIEPVSSTNALLLDELAAIRLQAFSGIDGDFANALQAAVWDGTQAISLEYVNYDILSLAPRAAVSTDRINAGITILRRNQPPMNSVPDKVSTDAGGSFGFSAATNTAITVMDPDAESADIRVQLFLSVADKSPDFEPGTLTIESNSSEVTIEGNGTRQITLTGPQSAINEVLEGIRYDTPDVGFAEVVRLQVQSNDLGNSGAGSALEDTDVTFILVGVAKFEVRDTTADEGAVVMYGPDPPGVRVIGTPTQLVAVTFSAPSGTVQLTETDGVEVTTDGNNQGTISLSGATGAINSALQSFAYTANPNSGPAHTITIQVDRDDDATATKTFMITYSPEVQEVAIDVRPFVDTNRIFLDTPGALPIVVFSSDSFDATRIDPLLVSFQGANVLMFFRLPLAFRFDVNRDGLQDLVVFIDNDEIDVPLGESEAVLLGETKDGKRFRGRDNVFGLSGPFGSR